MDGARLDGLIWKGRGKAATHIGLLCQLYRPLVATSPFTNPIMQMNVALNSGDSSYKKANEYADSLWYGDFDARQTRVGDYFVRQNDGSNWFIAGQQSLLPIIMVSCNRVLNVYRPQQQTGVGAVGYGGDTVAQETPLVTGYPGSVLIATKADRNLVQLPGDVRTPAWYIRLPLIPGAVKLRDEDIITDDLSRRYVITSAELTDLGWRIGAVQAET